jgi:hypothetical protein
MVGFRYCTVGKNSLFMKLARSKEHATLTGGVHVIGLSRFFFYDYVSFFRTMSIEVGLNRRVTVVRPLLPCYFYLYRANQLTVVQATGLSFCRHGDDLICDFAYVREKRYPRGNADRPRTAQ